MKLSALHNVADRPLSFVGKLWRVVLCILLGALLLPLAVGFLIMLVTAVIGGAGFPGDGGKDDGKNSGLIMICVFVGSVTTMVVLGYVFGYWAAVWASVACGAIIGGLFGLWAVNGRRGVSAAGGRPQH